MEISLQQKLTINWYNRAVRKLESDIFFHSRSASKKFSHTSQTLQNESCFPSVIWSKIFRSLPLFFAYDDSIYQDFLRPGYYKCRKPKKTEEKNLAEVSIVFRYLMLFVTIFECSAAQSLAICFTLKDEGNDKNNLAKLAFIPLSSLNNNRIENPVNSNLVFFSIRLHYTQYLPSIYCKPPLSPVEHYEMHHVYIVVYLLAKIESPQHTHTLKKKDF